MYNKNLLDKLENLKVGEQFEIKVKTEDHGVIAYIFGAYELFGYRHIVVAYDETDGNVDSFNIETLYRADEILERITKHHKSMLGAIITADDLSTAFIA